MRIAIYSRKSKFTGKGESIGNQAELCKEYIFKHLQDVTNDQIELFEDEGFSGKNTARPQFQRMLAIAHKRGFDYIVCYRLDRISRSVSDFSSLIEDLQHCKTAFICIKEQFDTSNPMGRAMMYIASVFAQLERETIAERIRDNMMLLARTGRWLGGTTPLGFASKQLETETTDGKIKTSFMLIPLADEQELVKLIFNRYLEFGSMTNVETYLLQQEIKTRQNKDFTPIALREILSNPVYCVADLAAYDYFAGHNADLCFEVQDFNGTHGILSFNRTSSEKNRQQGKNDISQWIIAIGNHKGLIESSRWIRAQAILEANKPKSAQRKVQNTASILSGILVCGTCGAFMRPRVNSNKHRDLKGNQTFSYLCDLKKKSKGTRCNSPNLSGNALDEIVGREVLRYYKVRVSAVCKLDHLKKQLLNDQLPAQTAKKAIQSKLDEKTFEIHALIKILVKSEESAALYNYTKQEIERLDDQIKALTGELAAEASSATIEAVSEQLLALEHAVKSFESVFQNAAVYEKRALLRTLVEKIVWDGKQVHLSLSGEADA